MSNILALNPKLDTRLILEPLGFIRAIELPLAILAFATTSGYGACARYIVSCPKAVGDGNSSRVALCWSYPFKIENEQYLTNPCQPQSSSPGTGYEYAFPGTGFSGSAEFFVFVGVITFLYCLLSLALYLLFLTLYTSDYRIPYIDFGVSAVLTLFWFIGSCAWANGVIRLKDNTSSDAIMGLFKNIQQCGERSPSYCKMDGTWDYASLNVTIIVGFACFFLWLANLWFIFKETAFYKARATPPSIAGNVPGATRQETPGMTGVVPT